LIDVGRDQFVLRARDRIEHRRQSVLLVVDVQLVQYALDHLLLIVFVEDHEVAAQADLGRVAAQPARADGVEHAEGQLARSRRAENLIEPFAHLARGLVRKRHRQNLARPDLAHLDEVGHAMGKHARLARTGSGQHQHRPIGRFHRPRLLRIESVKQIHFFYLSREGRDCTTGKNEISETTNERIDDLIRSCGYRTQIDTGLNRRADPIWFRHLTVDFPLQQAPCPFLLHTAPLLEKERHALSLALIANVDHPLFQQRPCARPGFAPTLAPHFAS
jgi:hypothetical protein